MQMVVLATPGCIMAAFRRFRLPMLVVGDVGEVGEMGGDLVVGEVGGDSMQSGGGGGDPGSCKAAMESPLLPVPSDFAE